MINIRKITLPNGSTQWCLLRGSAPALQRVVDARLEPHSVESCSSDIFIDREIKVFLKAPPVKSCLKDNLLKFCSWTPADKEVRGSRVLNRLGLQTTEILARAIPLNPFNKYRSLLYVQLLEDVIPLNEYLHNNPSCPQRQDILDTVARQLASMYRKGVSFRDFYFGNILYAVDGKMYWIDTEIQNYWIRKKQPLNRFLRKDKMMRSRFLKHGGHEEEWERFFNMVMENS